MLLCFGFFCASSILSKFCISEAKLQPKEGSGYQKVGARETVGAGIQDSIVGLNVPLGTLKAISVMIVLANHVTGAKARFKPNQTAIKL